MSRLAEIALPVAASLASRLGRPWPELRGEKKSLGEDEEKTWTTSWDSPIPQALKRLLRDIARMKKGDLALAPSVRIVDDFIRTIAKGKGHER